MILARTMLANSYQVSAWFSFVLVIRFLVLTTSSPVSTLWCICLTNTPSSSNLPNRSSHNSSIWHHGHSSAYWSRDPPFTITQIFILLFVIRLECVWCVKLRVATIHLNNVFHPHCVQPSFDISQLCFDSRGGVQNAPCTFTAMFIGTGLARLLCCSVSTIVHADYTATPYKNVQYNADYTARRLSEARV